MHVAKSTRSKHLCVLKKHPLRVIEKADLESKRRLGYGELSMWLAIYHLNTKSISQFHFSGISKTGGPKMGYRVGFKNNNKSSAYSRTEVLHLSRLHSRHRHHISSRAEYRRGSCTQTLKGGSKNHLDSEWLIKRHSILISWPL